MEREKGRDMVRARWGETASTPQPGLPHASAPRAVLTSSSFILMSFSVSASGVGKGRMGMGLSMRLSWVSLL